VGVGVGVAEEVVGVALVVGMVMVVALEQVVV
jgi:hypothetical protein